MRTAKLLVTGCLVALAVAACGSPTAGSAGAGAGDTLGTSATTQPMTPTDLPPTGATPTGKVVSPPIVRPPTSIPVPTLPRTPVPASQINTNGMPNAPQAVEVTNNGLDIVFNAEEAGCQQITAQVKDQTATTVTVDIVTTETGRGNQMCPMIVRDVQVAAALGKPLGNRTLVFEAVKRHS